MQYSPKLNSKEIEENHEYFLERLNIYKYKGFDVIKSRNFILEKSGTLKGNILEVGAGNGYTTLALAKAGYNFIAVDIDKEALKKAALNLAYFNLLHRVKLFVMDGKCLTFANSSFDNVVVINLFHHIAEPNTLLREINRVTKADGKLISADFNDKGLKVIDSVHREEGREHENCGKGQSYIISFLHDLGYEKLDSFDEGHHWVLVAEKTQEA